jgi:hypothetical protein
VPFHHELEEAHLVRREVVVGLLGRPDVSKEPDDTPGHVGRHGRSSIHSFAEAFEQPCRRGFLQEVAARAGTQRLEDPLVVVADRQHQQQHLRVLLAEEAHALKPGHAGQLDIHEREIGRANPEAVQRFLHRAVPPDAAEARGVVD